MTAALALTNEESGVWARAEGGTPIAGGRYTLFGAFAKGGMASVHFGLQHGCVGFSRPVALKCMHGQVAKNAGLANGFIDEARLAARIRHPNVVGTIDVLDEAGELFLVMEYVHGEPLSALRRSSREPIAPAIAASIMVDVLEGLHAAHEARSDVGEPLDIVHRDVSPPNIIIGVDGIARVLDFGIAKAAQRLGRTGTGQLKGKLRYLSTEQLNQHKVTRRTDVYAAGVVLWEMLTGRRLFPGKNPREILLGVLEAKVAAPSCYTSNISGALDAVVMKAVARDPSERFATALEMATALTNALAPACRQQVMEWMAARQTSALEERSERLSAIESGNADLSGRQVVVEKTGSHDAVDAMDAIAVLEEEEEPTYVMAHPIFEPPDLKPRVQPPPRVKPAMQLRPRVKPAVPRRRVAKRRKLNRYVLINVTLMVTTLMGVALAIASQL